MVSCHVTEHFVHSIFFKWFLMIEVLCQPVQCLPNGTVWCMYLKIHGKVVIHRVNLIFISRQLPGFEWSVNLLENCSRESNGSKY